MVKNLIGLIGIGIFLAACEQDDIFYDPGITDNHRVSIPLSVSPTLFLEEHSDYVPMPTKAAERLEAEIENTCRCLIMKEIDSKWYVDTLLKTVLDKSLSLYASQEVKTSGPVGTLDLILSPGHYRILVVANASGVAWNPDLTPGYLVKDETLSGRPVPYAFTYLVQTNGDFANLGYRSLYREIFTATYQFTVSKTGDLHSDPLNGNGSLSLSRKVSRFRLLLKKTSSPKENFSFELTPHFARIVLKATGDTPFCNGIDCWGDAYYDRKNPLDTFEMYISTFAKWLQATNGFEYQLVLPKNSTYPAVFIFTDELKTQGIPYQITECLITGKSREYTYYYDGTIEGHTLYPNSIDGIVLQPTDDYRMNPGASYPDVRVEIVPEENPVTLFDAFYEVNQR